MSAPVRVRFAPSPTGYLHIGGARTALFNWLYARHTGGKFILRIEDTDAARNSQEAVDVILKGLTWLGLDWDEGPTSPDANGPSRGDSGPYYQSQRGEIYRRRVRELMDRNMAYERDGAIRFRMTREPITIPDVIVGDVVRPLTDREDLDPDWVLVRSDGQPVFHLVNVVDDLEMGITHVLRGEDHLSNTAKHIALFRAFGATPPIYGHIPLILNPTGSKMSKRDVGASLQTYQDDGFSPEAVVNYLCLLGWSPKDNREFMPIREVVERFDLPQVLRHNARFDMKKMEFLHFEHTRNLNSVEFVKRGRAALEKAGISLASRSDDFVASALLTAREKGKLFKDLPPFVDFYFADDLAMPFDVEVREKALTAAARPWLVALTEKLSAAASFNAVELESLFKALAAEKGAKMGALVQPCRAACTGKLVGPSLYHLMEVLGRDRVQARLRRALEFVPGS